MNYETAKNLKKKIEKTAADFIKKTTDDSKPFGYPEDSAWFRPGETREDFKKAEIEFRLFRESGRRAYVFEVAAKNADTDETIAYFGFAPKNAYSAHFRMSRGAARLARVSTELARKIRSSASDEIIVLDPSQPEVQEAFEKLVESKLYLHLELPQAFEQQNSTEKISILEIAASSAA